MKIFPENPLIGVRYNIKGIGWCVWNSVSGWRKCND